MAIYSKEKRQAIFGIARPWMRNTFPVATPDEQWRMSVGNAYGGNALTPPVGGRIMASLIGPSGLVGHGGGLIG